MQGPMKGVRDHRAARIQKATGAYAPVAFLCSVQGKGNGQEKSVSSKYLAN